MKHAEAVRQFVHDMNYIPTSIIEKLFIHNEGVYEVTPPRQYDRVYVTGGEWEGCYGEIEETRYNGDKDLYLVQLDRQDDPIVISGDCLEVEHNDLFPMWGTMFVPEKIDQEWMAGEYGPSHLQEVADIGFRIYDVDDLGIVLGIDAAGFSFYEAYWEPLYRLRGLKWDDEE